MDFNAFLALTVTFLGLFWSFVFCYMATFSSNQVASISDIAYHVNWTEYPQIYRKYVLLIIFRSQSPGCFTGLKMFQCTLGTFVSVGHFQAFLKVSLTDLNHLFVFSLSNRLVLIISFYTNYKTLRIESFDFNNTCKNHPKLLRQNLPMNSYVGNII